MKTIIVLLAAFTTLANAALPARPATAPKITRTWKAADGRAMDAELLEFDAKEIRIKRTADLQIMKVPLAAFSKEDQEFVGGLLHERAIDESLTKGPFAEKMTGAFVQMVSKQGLNYQLYGNPKWDNTPALPACHLAAWLRPEPAPTTHHKWAEPPASSPMPNIRRRIPAS